MQYKYEYNVLIFDFASNFHFSVLCVNAHDENTNVYFALSQKLIILWNDK